MRHHNKAVMLYLDDPNKEAEMKAACDMMWPPEVDKQIKEMEDKEDGQRDRSL